MAIQEDQIPPQARDAWRKSKGRGGPSTLAWIMGIIVAVIVVWWAVSLLSPPEPGSSRTTTSQTTNAGPDANRVPNPNATPSKQP